jgi:hypothetical protein
MLSFSRLSPKSAIRKTNTIRWEVKRMGHIAAITNSRIDKNKEYMKPWMTAIGLYMYNFGIIELISYKFLDYLEETEEDFLKNVEKFLSPRIKRITKLAKQKKIKNNDDVVSIWNEVKELSTWRNRIAHNPAVPVWKVGSDSENSPPDFIGIPDIRQLSKNSKISDTISFEELNRLSDTTVMIAERLDTLLERVKQS